MSIRWVAGSELLEHSGSCPFCGLPIRCMAQDISDFGCHLSPLPNNSVCAGCVYAGIIGSKERKDWKMQWFSKVP